MSYKIVVERLGKLPTFRQRVEIVERKGIGHPDTIVDAIVDKISVELSKYYLKEFGEVMHHNIDKALLSAGEAKIKFGGGKVTKPMKVIIGDRATFWVGEERVPVEEIAIKTSKRWFEENLRFVDPEEHVRYQVELKKGSEALVDIFKRKKRKGVLGANDTSAAVGFAPQTPLEKLVVNLERFLNSRRFKKRFPESGEDIKIMGIRTRNDIELIIAMAFVDRFIASEDDYFRKKEEILDEIKDYVSKNSDFSRVEIKLNHLDARGRGIAGLYLTVLGTCADSADCGQVGRGNRANGVISLSRPAGSEAAAGKNPVSHVGKIYSALSFLLAEKIYESVEGLEEVTVWLVSRIGEPVDKPALVNVQVIPEKKLDKRVAKEVEDVVTGELQNVPKLCKKLALGKLSLYY